MGGRVRPFPILRLAPDWRAGACFACAKHRGVFREGGVQFWLQSCRPGGAAHLQTVALGCALITPGVLLDQVGAGLRGLALE